MISWYMNPLKVEKIGEVVNADAIDIRLLNYLSANFQTPWEQKSNQGEVTFSSQLPLEREQHRFDKKKHVQRTQEVRT